MTFINFLNSYWYWFLLGFFVILVLVLIGKRFFSVHRIKKQEVKHLQKPELRKKQIVMADFKQIDVEYKINPAQNKLIIFVNDFYHQKEDYKKYQKSFLNANFNYLTFNYRYHHSEVNQEKLSLGILVSDLETIINLVKEQYPEQKVYLIGHGFGANIIMCLLKSSSLITKAILLNMIGKTNFIEYDWKLRRTSYYGFWFNRNVILPVILLENLITTDLASQLKLKEYFENKPLHWWYQFQMKVLISKSLKRLKRNSQDVLLIQSQEHIFSNKKSWSNKAQYEIHWVQEDHDLLWSDNYQEYCQLIQSWINE